MKPHRLLDPLKAPALSGRLCFSNWIAGQAGRPVAVWIGHRPLSHRREIHLSRISGSRILVSLDTSALRRDPRVFSMHWRRTWIFVHLFARADRSIGEATAHVGDACMADGPILAFSSNRSETVLVPDRGFIRRNAFADYRRLVEANAVAWDDRDDLIVWRGSPSGIGRLPRVGEPCDAPEILPRIRLCALLRDSPRTDARIRLAPKVARAVDWPAQCDELTGEYIPETSWIGRRFAVDIDGNANAFSNFYTRLLFGCCVLKVTSPRGYRQWYYENLVPGTHFVPVRSDLSDLLEKIAWCQAHIGRCRDIARAGQEFAMSMELKPEMEKAVERINSALAS